MKRLPTNKSSIGGSPDPPDPTASTATDATSHSAGRSNTGDVGASLRGTPSRPSTKSHDPSHHIRRSSFSRSESSPWDSFFASEPPPPNIATAGLRVRQFVKPLHEKEELLNARVAIITAGGTDVPLEREPVRYITNTSTGNRGAGLCEQFLRLGYYVIFLTSVRAVKPFVRHLMPSHPMPHILDFLSLEGYQQQQEEEQEQTTSLADEHIEPVASEGEVSVPPASATSRRLAGQASGMGPEAAPVEALGSVLSSSSSLAGEENREEGTPAGEPVASAAGDPSSGGRWDGTPEEGSRWRVIFREPRKRGEEESHEGALEQIDALGWELNTGEAAAALEVHRQCRNRLLCLSYQTLVEYSFLVRAIVAGAAPLRERLMFCSAAAVADFYVPHALMPHHKLRAPQQQEGAPQYAPAGSELLEGPTREMGSVEVQGPSRSVSSMEGSHPKRWFAESFLTGEGPKGTSEAASAGSTTVTSDQQHHLTLRLHLVPKMLLMHGTIEAKLARYLTKLQSYKLKEALI